MVFDYDSISQLLTDELRRRVSNNPNYSLRSFARNLHLSPGALSEILRGRRDLSLKSVPAVAKAMGLNSTEARHLLSLAQSAKAHRDGHLLELTGETRNPEAHQLSVELFALISEWYHFAILNLLDIDGFQWKAAWIAGRLDITRLQAQMAMDLLLRLGLIRPHGKRFVGKTDHVLSQSEIPSAAIRTYHRQILKKAEQAVDTQDLGERDFCGCGFALDPKHLPAIKKDISRFQDQLLAKYSTGKKSEVYFLETALFKLTKGKHE